MEKIKILRIIARLNIGGPAIHTILLNEGLNKDKFNSILACGVISDDEGDMSYYAAQKKIKPIFIPELKRELNCFCDFSALRKIYKLMKTEQPDILHTHTAKAGALGRLAAIFYNISAHKKVKLFHTFHGHIFDGYFNKIQTRFFILVERSLAIFTDKIITVSNSIKQELISFGICSEDKIQIIPLGLELERFLDILPRNDKILNIGIIGRLVPVKNHRLFLESAAQIIHNNPVTRLRFKIIGDGQLRNELEEYSHKLNIAGNIEFTGWQKDLVTVYSDLDIVALTSLNEGTPVSLIEAMASAKAIVATDVGGVRDLLGQEINLTLSSNEKFKVLERGLIAASGDRVSFAAAINFLLNNNELRKNIGMRARDYVSKVFTKERLVKDMENLYENILDSAA